MSIKFEYNVPPGDNNLIVRMDDVGPAMKISKGQIERMITEGVEYMISSRKEGLDANHWFQYTGDTFIFIGWEDDDLLSIMVTTPRQRGEVEIPSIKSPHFEEED
jgi:hypothetical protein